MKTEVLKILSHSVNEERTYKYNTHCAFLKCTRQTCTTTSQLAPLFGTWLNDRRRGFFRNRTVQLKPESSKEHALLYTDLHFVRARLRSYQHAPGADDTWRTRKSGVTRIAAADPAHSWLPLTLESPVSVIRAFSQHA